MKQRLLTILMGLIIILSACSEDVIDMRTTNDFNASKSKTGFVSMQEAKARLSAIVTEINSQISDPANRFPEISQSARMSGIALNADMRPLTRGEDETEAGCYVFRLENDMFAIMSANTSTPELLAVGNGYPNFEDSTALLPNPAYWNPISAIDSAIVNGDGDTIVTKIIETTYSIVKQDICPVKWGNKYPYNSKLDYIYAGTDNDGLSTFVRPAAGCVAVAAAQIMTADNLQGAYYKNHDFDWYYLADCREARDFEVLPEIKDQVGILFKDLTNSENIKVSSWGVNTTWASIESISDALANFNFSQTGKRIVYNFDTLKNELEKDYPVCIDAYGGTYDNLDIGRHIWVCHGLMKATFTVGHFCHNKNSSEAPKLLYTTTEEAWYLQMNWGWDGKGDGYYLAQFDDFLDNIKGPDIPEEGTKPSGGYNIYQPHTNHWYYIYYGFRME